ncbi:Mitogen-activated protein kinase kinase kinase A [Diplonema papillatum]|nr:Mitogen-activated protein kinase kinase kinase A [Diplonema papillatum]
MMEPPDGLYLEIVCKIAIATALLAVKHALPKEEVVDDTAAESSADEEDSKPPRFDPSSRVVRLLRLYLPPTICLLLAKTGYSVLEGWLSSGEAASTTGYLWNASQADCASGTDELNEWDSAVQGPSRVGDGDGLAEEEVDADTYYARKTFVVTGVAVCFALTAFAAKYSRRKALGALAPAAAGAAGNSCENCYIIPAIACIPSAGFAYVGLTSICPVTGCISALAMGACFVGGAVGGKWVVLSNCQAENLRLSKIIEARQAADCIARVPEDAPFIDASPDRRWKQKWVVSNGSVCSNSEPTLTEITSDTSDTCSSGESGGVRMVAEAERWVKGALLGRGSYGSVHVGVLRGGDLVAVKVIDLHSELAARDHEVQRVQQEVAFMRELDHANIIRYKGVSFDAENSSIAIFMEYAVGGSLASLVRKCHELLSEDVIRLYTRQVLQGLAFLHSRGVVHRDIKGANILLGADGTAKLADFGCARQLRSSRLCATQIGSPYWMAPEVIKHGTRYGTEADIWSLGCTAIEALNGGDAPWKEFESVFAAMFHITSTDEGPNNTPHGLSATCQSFLELCFRRNVPERPSAEIAIR